MKVILFGATGMVGQGVLRECLRAPDVESVLAVGRSASGQSHEKLQELVAPELFDLGPRAAEFSDFDACFFCLGVSSVGMGDLQYRRVTKDLTLSVAGLLAPLSPRMTFVYVSGSGTDSTEHGRLMWARVKGETENALLRLPFKAVYLFRPAYIQPVHGVRSRTRWASLLYGVLGPLYPLWKTLFPNWVTTTETIGKAMLAVARHGAPKPVLETLDINALGSERSAGTLPSAR